MKCDLFVTVCEGVWKRLLCECEAIVWRVCVWRRRMCALEWPRRRELWTDRDRGGFVPLCVC